MNPHPNPDAVRRRNRGMLVALFLLFFGGMLAAGLLRFSGWRPEGAKNKGEMLQPYGDLREYTPTLVDGATYGWKDAPRTWRIVVMPRECDAARAAACARLLQDLHKVRELMGKEAYRVHLLWAGALPAGASLPAEARALRVDAGLRAGLVRGDDPAGDAVWLVDPNGFVVLRYAPGFDPGDLRYDLAKLLKIN
jgi:hypothetical protein